MKNFNNKLAVIITNAVGTMLTAYIFTIIGGMGIYYSLTGNAKGTLIIGSISGYFLQLVLLPIIIVGQRLQSEHIKAIHKHLGIKHGK